MIVSTHGILANSGGIIYTGLLDTYSGAIGAYSLQKLRNGYSGYAIRVVRSNDSQSLDIGFDSNGNLDVTALINFVTVYYGRVSIFYDQSGNGNHAIQNAFANQPFIVINGILNTLNGKPIITTNGINSSKFFEIPISNIQNRPISIITVGKIYQLPTNVYGNLSFFIGGTVNPGGGSRYELLVNSSVFGSNLRGTSTSLGIGTFSTNPFIMQAHFASSTLTNRLNGTDISMTINDSGQFSTPSNFVLMNAPSNAPDFSANIGFYECIFYLNDKTSDKAGIETNINQRYSIY